MKASLWITVIGVVAASAAGVVACSSSESNGNTDVDGGVPADGGTGTDDGGAGNDDAGETPDSGNGSCGVLDTSPVTFYTAACKSCVASRCCAQATSCFGADPTGFDAGPSAGDAGAQSYCSALYRCTQTCIQEDGGYDLECDEICYDTYSNDNNGVGERLDAFEDCLPQCAEFCGGSEE